MKFLALLFIMIPLAASGKTQHFKGFAYKSKDKKVLRYTESHKRVYKAGKLFTSETTYLNPEGKKIATLKCNYSKSPTLPDFEFEDLRTGNWEKTVVENGVAKVQYREDKDSKIKTKNFKDLESLSASQGLNEFIRLNLEKIKEGDDLVTTFLIPAKLMDIDILVTGEETKSDEVEVSIKVDNWFLRIFAPKLELVYSPKGGDLMAYYGNSNIETDKGKQQKVYIEYDYSSKKHGKLHAKR